MNSKENNEVVIKKPKENLLELKEIKQ